MLQPFVQQLQELRVVGYTGSYFPEWMSSPSLIHLRKLRIKNCKSCLHLPQLEKLPSLKELTIWGCLELEIDDLGKLPSLKVLKLYELPNLTRLSREDGENMFQQLFILEIRRCPNLLGLPCLPSLKKMSILGKCKHDLPSSIHKFGSLEYFKIEELNCFPDGMLRNLTSLKELDIWNCSEIEGLGEDLQHVTSLQSLSLEDLPNLTSLPDCFGNLSSLQKLSIVTCPKLTCLPVSIQSLAALITLEIWECPELERRCKRETGEDWPTISHIPHLEGMFWISPFLNTV